MQELAEKLRIFTRNCEVIREYNAQDVAMGRKVRLLPSLASMDALLTVLGKFAFCSYIPSFWLLSSAHVA